MTGKKEFSYILETFNTSLTTYFVFKFVPPFRVNVKSKIFPVLNYLSVKTYNGLEVDLTFLTSALDRGG